jgi:hypothetical protein
MSRLSAGNMFGMARIDKNHLNGPFHDIENRPPVNASTLYCYNRRFVFQQPAPQCLEILSKRLNFTLFYALPCGCLLYPTRNYHLPVNVQTTANGVQNLQRFGIFLSGNGNILFD